MWNCLDLKCPRNDMVDYELNEMCVANELRDLVTTLTTAADVLTAENPLWEELFVLRNIQAKCKRLLRCDKCLVYLHRVSHCLKKMVLLNLSKSYLDLAELFLLGFSSQDSIGSVKLPSRQQVEYILVRTVSAAKLICDGIKYSQETFCYLLQKLKVGHTILDLVTAGSVTARLIVLLKAMLEQICTLYQQVLATRNKLKKGAFEWTEELVHLPIDLKNWVQESNAEILKPLPMSQKDMKMFSSILKISGETNEDSDTDSIILVNEVKKNGNGVSTKVQNGNSTDYGEIIPRKKQDRLTKKQKSLLQKIVCVQNIEDLENMWSDVISSSEDILPVTLTKKKQKIVSKLFLEIRNSLSKKNINKKSKQPSSLKNALTMFSKKLGFTQDEIEMCHGELKAVHSNEVKLEPVKKIKELKLLYKKLSDILQFSNKLKKRRKLQNIFRRRLADIRLLKQNGEKTTSKQLIFCTSKVILTLCQR